MGRTVDAKGQPHQGFLFVGNQREHIEWLLLFLIVAGFSSFDGEHSLPHVLAQGSPIFHSSLKGELGIALESLQGKIDLI